MLSLAKKEGQVIPVLILQSPSVDRIVLLYEKEFCYRILNEWAGRYFDRDSAIIAGCFDHSVGFESKLINSLIFLLRCSSIL